MKAILTFVYLFLASHLFSQSQPEELGKVTWLRSYDKAIEQAQKQNKPIYILFQEIPGCSTCKNFGNNVMKNQLIVEMIETYFIPLAIHNNKSGDDATILKKYNEAAWNNPVSHIVDKNGKDLITKLSGAYSEAAVITFIRKGIEADKKLVPKYIQLIEEEYTAIKKEVVLEMYCFWSGEMNIARQKGIIKTEPGFSNGREVVKVTFDESATDEMSIIKEASKSKNADAVHTNQKNLSQNLKSQNIVVKNIDDFRLDNDIHFYLKKSIYANIYMTPMQATKANSLIGQGLDPNELFSPWQLLLLERVKAKKEKNGKRYLEKV